MASKPRTIRGAITAIAKGTLSTDRLRKILMRSKNIHTVLHLQDQYVKKLDKLIEQAHIVAAERGTELARVKDEETGVQFTAKTLKSLEATRKAKSPKKGDKYMSLERQGQIYRKLFPMMMKDKDVGHQNIAVVTAYLAIALKGLSKDDPLRKQIAACYLLAKELDKITNKAHLRGSDLSVFFDSVNKVIASKKDISIDFTADVDMVSGTKGTVKGTSENRALNRLKGVAARAIMQLYNAAINEETEVFAEALAEVNWEDIEQSPSLFDDIADLVYEGVNPELTPTRKRRSRKSKASSKGGAKVTKNPLNKGKKLKEPKFGRVPKSRSAVDHTSFQKSLFSVVALLNTKLPSVIQKNMTAPRLENQTGRFANSVKVLDAQVTREGFPSFGYTYQRNPYGVYEDGTGKDPWSNGERDPRQLIDSSIREVAANLALGRFYTRRL
tara:strand:- start:10868 stop:12193 length:1326 start_codon:yes stop_codon:yes gene_type:complete